MRGQAYLVAAGLFLAALPAGSIGAQGGPPVAKRITKVDTLHGDILRDDYYWLREKTNPEVVRYLEDENAYTASGLAHLRPIQDSIYREMLGRIKETDLSVPWHNRGYWYYERTEQGKDYPILCRKKGTLRAKEDVILDQNQLAKGKAYHALGGWEVSADGNLLAYSEDTTAFREYTLRLKDLRTGRLLPDSVTGVWTGIAFAADGRTLFYSRADSAKRPNQVWRHVIGTPAERDVKVFQEDNLLYRAGLQLSKSGKYIFIYSSGFSASETRFVPADRPTETPRVFAPRRANVEYSVDHIPGRFLIHTNDGATNFRIAVTPESDIRPAAGWDGYGWSGCQIAPPTSSPSPIRPIASPSRRISTSRPPRCGSPTRPSPHPERCTSTISRPAPGAS
jgi:oligopeptidase B